MPKVKIDAYVAIFVMHDPLGQASIWFDSGKYSIEIVAYWQDKQKKNLCEQLSLKLY